MPFFKNLPMQNYHSDNLPPEVLQKMPRFQYPSWSSSNFASILANGMHQVVAEKLAAYQDPSIVSNASPRMIQGSVLHALVLGDETTSLVVVDATDWRTKDAREAKAEALKEGKLPILKKDIERYMTIADEIIGKKSLLNNIRTKDAISEGSIYWEERGVWYRSRPDILPSEKSIKDGYWLIDYKTTELTFPEFIKTQFISYLLAVKIVHYIKSVYQLYGVYPNFALLIQEMKPPYASVFQYVNTGWAIRHAVETNTLAECGLPTNIEIDDCVGFATEGIKEQSSRTIEPSNPVWEILRVGFRDWNTVHNSLVASLEIGGKFPVPAPLSTMQIKNEDVEKWSNIGSRSVIRFNNDGTPITPMIMGYTLDNDGKTEALVNERNKGISIYGEEPEPTEQPEPTEPSEPVESTDEVVTNTDMTASTPVDNETGEISTETTTETTTETNKEKENESTNNVYRDTELEESATPTSEFEDSLDEFNAT